MSRLLILKLFAHIASHFCPGNGDIFINITDTSKFLTKYDNQLHVILDFVILEAIINSQIYHFKPTDKHSTDKHSELPSVLDNNYV